MKLYDHIPKNLGDWALQQRVFFVSSAPLTGKHVNCSPKGLPGATFTIFDANNVAYVDATGSGNETISHIYENGRVTIMFCSFDTLPRIMRFFCRGSVIEWDDPQFDATLERMGKQRVDGARAIIMLKVWKVQTSCGTGVPLIGRAQSLEEEGENDASAGNGGKIMTKAAEIFQDRETMSRWARGHMEKGTLEPYQRDNNAFSMDGLTGMRAAMKSQGQWLVLEDAKTWASRVVAGQWESFILGLLLGVILMTVFFGRASLVSGISKSDIIFPRIM